MLEPAEVVKVSGQDASWLFTWRGVLGIPTWEEAPGGTQRTRWLGSILVSLGGVIGSEQS